MSNEKPSMGEIMQKAQELQKKMQESQRKLTAMEVHGEAGGGLAKITLNCQHEMKKIFLDDALLKEPKDVVEDVIIAAYSDAKRKAEELMKKEMANLTKEMGLPGDFGGGSGSGAIE